MRIAWAAPRRAMDRPTAIFEGLASAGTAVPPAPSGHWIEPAAVRGRMRVSGQIDRRPSFRNFTGFSASKSTVGLREPDAMRKLDVIDIPNPCPRNWDDMIGDERARFCSHCQKHVYNLSVVSASEAEKLIWAAAGELCVRFEKDSQGDVITLDYAPPPPRRRWLTAVWLGAAIATLLGMIVRAGQTTPRVVVGAAPARPTTRPVVMGTMPAVCNPNPAQTAPSDGAPKTAE